MFDPNALPVPDLGLVCKGCGYALCGLEDHVCPKCGQRFTLQEYIPKGDFPQLIADGHFVRATDQIVDLLYRYHIPYIEQIDPLSQVFGVLGASVDRGPYLCVPRECFLEAVDLLRRHQLGEPLPTSPPKDHQHPPWPCPSCQETNPPNFEICWKCGESQTSETG